MTRVVGIDPGTVSLDLCGRDGDAVFLDESFPTAAIGADPEMLVELLQGARPLDLVVGPSGYGLPWTDVRDVGAGELALLFLADAADGPRGTILGGMGRLVEALRASGLPVCFSPSVAHLPTVPAHRKVNRIDMGTADKLCAVALGVWDQARRLGLPCSATSFVFVEAGGAFTAVIGVDGGAVVDGAGGTSGAPGFRAMGAMDGELAYLLRDFSKDVLASGGAAWVCGDPDCTPGDLVRAAAAGGPAAVALDALLEGIEKQVAAQVTVLGTPREILLSGRLSRVPEIRRLLAERLSRFAPVCDVGGFAAVASEAAQGAALLGQGLAGQAGLRDLVEALQVRSAAGSVLDHLYVSETESLRRRHPSAGRAPAPFWERS